MNSWMKKVHFGGRQRGLIAADRCRFGLVADQGANLLRHYRTVLLEPAGLVVVEREGHEAIVFFASDSAGGQEG